MARKIPPLLPNKGHMSYQQWQVTSGNNQQKCSHIVPAVAVHLATNTPMQAMHHIQTWSRPVHCRLTVPQQPCRKQRSGNCRNEYECE